MTHRSVEATAPEPQPAASTDGDVSSRAEPKPTQPTPGDAEVGTGGDSSASRTPFFSWMVRCPGILGLPNVNDFFDTEGDLLHSAIEREPDPSPATLVPLLLVGF